MHLLQYIDEHKVDVTFLCKSSNFIYSESKYSETTKELESAHINMLVYVQSTNSFAEY